MNERTRGRVRAEQGEKERGRGEGEEEMARVLERRTHVLLSRAGGTG
jgi:hypothetical protein